MAQRINENTLQIVNTIGTDGYVRLVGSDGVSYRMTVQALLDIVNANIDIDIDDTLTVSGAAADAKAVGDELDAIKEDLGDLADLDTTDKSNLVAAINEAAQSGGSGSGGITVVGTVAEMTDTSSVYLYNGTETGYTAGHWYFYNSGTSAWTDGGSYTGWETVDTALENFLDENAQTLSSLTIKKSDNTVLGTYNGTNDVVVTLPESGGSGGSVVEVTQTLTSGTEIGSISVDGESTTLYAPESTPSGGGSTLTWTTIADVDFTQTNGAQNFEYSNLPSYTKIVIVTFTPVSSSTSDSRAMVTLNTKTPSSNDLFKIYKGGTTYYTNNIVMEYDGKFWWISRNEDRNTNSSNENGGYGTWKKWTSPIQTGACTYLKLYCLAAPVSGEMHIYGGK